MEFMDAPAYWQNVVEAAMVAENKADARRRKSEERRSARRGKGRR